MAGMKGEKETAFGKERPTPEKDGQMAVTGKTMMAASCCMSTSLH